MPTPTRPRYHLLDALRGLSLVLMLAYHLGFTLLMFGLLPEGVLFNPLLRVLQPLFAGVFITLCGISSRFSRGNLKRGLITLACAAAVTAVMWWFLATPLWFGILHFLGCCMVIYAAIGRLIEKLPPAASLATFLALFAACFALLPMDAANDWLCWLGFATPAFRQATADYFPLGRWIFLFLAGSVMGGSIRGGQWPKWFYEFNMPVLPWIGRHTLVIYMAHQPVFYGVILLVTRLAG